MHGTFTDYRYWTPQMKAFAEKHRVFAVSLRHYFPEKWNGEGGKFSVRQHVEDLAEFVKKLNLGQSALARSFARRGGGTKPRQAASRARANVDPC